MGRTFERLKEEDKSVIMRSTMTAIAETAKSLTFALDGIMICIRYHNKGR